MSQIHVGFTQMLHFNLSGFHPDRIQNLDFCFLMDAVLPLIDRRGVLSQLEPFYSFTAERNDMINPC